MHVKIMPSPSKAITAQLVALSRKIAKCPACLQHEVHVITLTGFIPGYFKREHQLECHRCGTRGPRSVLLTAAVYAWNELTRIALLHENDPHHPL
jgi:hypothetical protein